MNLVTCCVKITGHKDERKIITALANSLLYLNFQQLQIYGTHIMTQLNKCQHNASAN